MKEVASVKGCLFPAILEFKRRQALQTAGVVTRRVISSTPLTLGMELRKEIWALSEDSPASEDTEIEAVYNEEGLFVGDFNTYKLLSKYGIRPQKNEPSHSVCSIGFSPKEQKWYGWSHRAIFGYGVGDDFYHPDTAFGDGGKKPPSVILSLAEAEQAARNFARDVS